MKHIPKKLHTYWNGSSMSELQAFTVSSFHKYNPDWEINVYVPKQEAQSSQKYIPDYTGKDYFPSVKALDYVNIKTIDLDDYGINPELHDILRSDIFRYYKLYDEGGVWSDFDVIWLKPMSHFKNIEYHGDVAYDDIRTVVSMNHGSAGAHSIGILIHCKNDPYMASVIELTKKVGPPYKHEVFGAKMIQREYNSLESMSEFDGVIGTRLETYYPYSLWPHRNNIHMLYQGNSLGFINNNVLCVHWYNGHHYSKNYVNSNGFNRDCTMTTILKKEGLI